MSGKRIPICLTIAGSDSGGGAGVQADMKTFSSLETFATSAITAITAQNSFEVTAIQEIEPQVVYKQIQAVATDFSVDACKTGMLSSEAIIRIVAAAIRDFSIHKFVLDPVMISKSGATLLQPTAMSALKQELLPLSMVLTPNLPEAEEISGVKIMDDTSLRQAAEKILDFGPQWLVIKGGHSEGAPIDYVFSRRYQEEFQLPAPRINTRNTHGSGCTYAAAITAYLARNASPRQAIEMARQYVQKGIESSLSIGKGHGPLHHFHPWYRF